jgi:hypothetical protein
MMRSLLSDGSLLHAAEVASVAPVLFALLLGSLPVVLSVLLYRRMMRRTAVVVVREGDT